MSSHPRIRQQRAALVLEPAVEREAIGRLRLAGWERYAHALAGMAIASCGLAMQFLGL